MDGNTTIKYLQSYIRQKDYHPELLKDYFLKLSEEVGELSRAMRKGLKAKDGYCPCRVGKLPQNKCICEEFREQMADPDFEGYCHCMLYYKEK